ncbi:TonB-dependent siderophore receptor [Hydrogenophaga sp.]|uniref:TonB-dependent siderophore receptor n=1 Tax=Hydrogenophaga sp. TaxID=1904254 RepID=UPI002FCBB10E
MPDIHPPRHRRTPTVIARLRPVALAVHLACAAMLALVTGVASQVHAQAAPAVGAVQADVPAGALGEALNRFALQAGAAIVVDAAQVRGKTTAGLKGAVTVEEGFHRLLQGSGLQLGRTPAGFVLMAQAPAAQAVPAPGTATAQATLPSVTVTAAAFSEHVKGPVVGYVARRSATGTKTDTPLIESPQSVSVITAEEIGDRKATTLDETLRYTAGVTSNAKPWASDQMSLVRGFALESASVFLDGLQNPSTAAMGAIEPYGMERIEVLRGPASVLYGQVAPGGVINAVSKRPQAEPVRELGVEYGRYDRKTLKADLGGAIDEAGTLTYRLVGLVRRADTRLDHDRDDRVYVAPSLTWQPSAATKLTLLASYQEDDQSYAWANQLRNPGALGQPDPAVNIGGLDNRWKRSNTTLGYELEHRFNDTWQLRQNLRYGDLDREGTDVFNLGLRPNGRHVGRAISPREAGWRGVTLDTHAQASFITGTVSHTALLGVDYTRSRLTFTRRNANAVMPDLDLFDPVYAPQALTPLAAPYKDESPARQLGVYLQDQLKWNRWVATAGMRHDQADQSSKRINLLTGLTTPTADLSSSATTGRVGVVRLFDSGWAPYLSYATSFAPETGLDATGRSLKPSRGKQFEAGVRYQPASEDFSFTASVFDLTRENVKTSVPGMAGVFQQTGEVRAQGLELELRARLTRSFSLVGQYTNLDTRVTRSSNGDQGLSPMAVPRHNASLWGKYGFAAFGGQPAFAALGVRHVGASRSGQDFDNANLRNPSLTLVDAALGLDVGAWRYSLNVDNLFDTQKLVDCDATFCYRSPQRSWRVGATYRF